MPIIKTENSPLRILIIQMTYIYYTHYKSKTSFQRHVLQQIEHYTWLNNYTYIPIQSRMYVVKERISVFSWNDVVFSPHCIIYFLCSLLFFSNYSFCRTGQLTFGMYCSWGLSVFCYEFSTYIYTGCFTTLGHNCRRWFPRFLWSKKFI